MTNVEPVRSLCRAVLAGAIREAQGRPVAHTDATDTRRCQAGAARARRWLGGARMGPVTFTLTCDALSLDPLVVQEGLVRRGILDSPDQEG